MLLWSCHLATIRSTILESKGCIPYTPNTRFHTFLHLTLTSTHSHQTGAGYYAPRVGWDKKQLELGR